MHSYSRSGHLSKWCIVWGGGTFAFEVLAVVQISPPVEGLLGTPYSSKTVETFPFCSVHLVSDPGGSS